MFTPVTIIINVLGRLGLKRHCPNRQGVGYCDPPPFHTNIGACCEVTAPTGNSDPSAFVVGGYAHGLGHV